VLCRPLTAFAADALAGIVASDPAGVPHPEILRQAAQDLHPHPQPLNTPFSAMEDVDAMDDAPPVFYIGQHERKRTLDVSAELVQHAQDLGVGGAKQPFHCVY